MISLSNKWKWIGRSFLILISLIILFWSLVTAGFEKLKVDIKENTLKNVPIEYIEEINNGERIKKTHKVPESKVEPGSIRYPLKVFRDRLWILLSRTPKDKAEVYLLIADKRMFETTELIRNQKNENLILKTLTDSIYNLREAKKCLFEENIKDIEFFEINQQITQTGLAYETIIKSFNYKNEKINNIIDELEIWNQKNKEYGNEN